METQLKLNYKIMAYLRIMDRMVIQESLKWSIYHVQNGQASKEQKEETIKGIREAMSRLN